MPAEAGAADFEHESVMLDEIVAAFESVPTGVVVDATVGGGGHSEGILDARPDVSVLGLDRDPAALAAANERLARFGSRFSSYRCRFDDLGTAMAAADVDRLSGALFDLGVSSPQLDQGERGFSYRHDGPLDMRMDTDAQWSASDVVNGYDEAELRRVIRKYGDERFASRIARAIVASRPIETTTELAAIVTGAIPAAARRTGGHPAKRTFQAIRIEVNGELEVLAPAIDAAIEAVVPGGRIAVLSYHSGEDRIVKDRFRAATGACECPPELPCVCGAVQTVRLVRGVRRTPTDAEKASNRRAASARLRVAERTEPTRRGGGR
jgi:16S rRNA (cytosine1402-N4)-methyltransferase